MQLHVLRDPWVPLEREGRVEHASVIEILCGEKDAADLLHPRDDVRFFARMLLSSLAQALFTPANKSELRARIETPMRRDEVEPRIAPFERDFELIGTSEQAGFLQDPGGQGEDGTEKLLLDLAGHVLFRSLPERDPARAVGLCAPCAVPLLYGVQAFAASGGRGYSPSIRGRPATTTLLAEPSVRRSVWANTLHRESIALLPFAPEGSARPWAQARRELHDTDRLSVAEGLFWQPRALQLVPCQVGPCAACGRSAERAQVQGFRAKSKAGAAFFPHPWSPTVERKKKGRTFLLHVHLRPERPVWTGLVDMLGAVGEATRAAPVVDQWRESLDEPAASLLVLDYATDQASFVGRFCESFPISRAHVGDPAFLHSLRDLIASAESALDALRRALKAAHSSRGARPKTQRDGYWAADAEASFWQATEAVFWRAYRGLLDGSLESSKPFRQELERTALRLFDEHTRASIDDPGRIDVIVGARRSLRFALAEMVEPRPAGQPARKPKRKRGAEAAL